MSRSGPVRDQRPGRFGHYRPCRRVRIGGRCRCSFREHACAHLVTQKCDRWGSTPRCDTGGASLCLLIVYPRMSKNVKPERRRWFGFARLYRLSAQDFSCGLARSGANSCESAARARPPTEHRLNLGTGYAKWLRRRLGRRRVEGHAPGRMVQRVAEGRLRVGRRPRVARRRRREARRRARPARERRPHDARLRHRTPMAPCAADPADLPVEIRRPAAARSVASRSVRLPSVC